MMCTALSVPSLVVALWGKGSRLAQRVSSNSVEQSRGFVPFLRFLQICFPVGVAQLQAFSSTAGGLEH